MRSNAQRLKALLVRPGGAAAAAGQPARPSLEPDANEGGDNGGG
jgi:hypothetical protein